jgi:hypothetical protein
MLFLFIKVVILYSTGVVWSIQIVILYFTGVVVLSIDKTTTPVKYKITICIDQTTSVKYKITILIDKTTPVK